VVNGWQIAGTTSFQSGTPYNVETGFDSNGDGVTNDRPSLGNPHAPLASYAFTGDWDGLSPNILCDGPTLWFLTSALVSRPSQVHWIVPSNGQGNVGRNSLIGPWYTSWAFSLTRTIKVHESQRADPRGLVQPLQPDSQGRRRILAEHATGDRALSLPIRARPRRLRISPPRCMAAARSACCSSTASDPKPNQSSN
jgi:hypothetical protein